MSMEIISALQESLKIHAVYQMLDVINDGASNNEIIKYNAAHEMTRLTCMGMELCQAACDEMLEFTIGLDKDYDTSRLTEKKILSMMDRD